MYKHALRHPRTTQERRATGKRNKWGRAKRNFVNLPNAWDDFWVKRQRSWKKKRKTQYNPEGRGQKYTIYIEAVDRAWNRHNRRAVQLLREFFERFDIAYDIKDDFEIEYHWEVSEGQYWWVPIPVLDLDPDNRNLARRDENGNAIVLRYKYDYRWIPRNKSLYWQRKKRKFKGEIITYWTNKNIVLPDWENI
jgi:hypothetical protein